MGCRVGDNLKIEEMPKGYADYKGQTVAEFVRDGAYVKVDNHNVQQLNNVLQTQPCSVRLIKKLDIINNHQNRNHIINIKFATIFSASVVTLSQFPFLDFQS